MTEPLSDERLAEIRRHHDHGAGCTDANTECALLAEVDRLRGES